MGKQVETDEFGIPIRKAQKPQVDEFGIAIKKKSVEQPGQVSPTTSQAEPNYAQLQFNNFVKGLEQEGIKKVEGFIKDNGVTPPDPATATQEQVDEYNKKLPLVEQYAKQIDAEVTKKADDRIKTIQNFNVQLAKSEENALIRQHPVVGELRNEFTKTVDKLKDNSNIRIEEFKSTNPSEYDLQQFTEKEKKNLDESIEPAYQKYRGTVSQIQKDPDFAKGFTEQYKKETFKTQFPITEALRKGIASMLGDTFGGSQAASIAGSMDVDFDDHLRAKGTTKPQKHAFTKEEAKQQYIEKVGKAQYDEEKKEWIGKQVAIKEGLSKYSKEQEGQAAGYLHNLPETWAEAKQKGALGISEYIAKNTGGVVGLAAPAVAASVINPYLGGAVMAQSGVALEKGEAFNKGIDMLEENTGLSRKELFEKDLDSLLRSSSTQSGLINGTMEFISEVSMIGKFLPKGTLPKVLSRVLKNAAIQIPASTLIEGSTEWAQAIDTDYSALKGQVDASGKPIYDHDQIMEIINKNIDEGSYDEDFIGGVTGAIGMGGLGGLHTAVRGQMRKERLQNIKTERSQRVAPEVEPAQAAAEPAPTEPTAQQPEATKEQVIIEQAAQVDESKMIPADVKEIRNEVKETVHKVAEEAGIDINTPEFKAVSKQLTGKAHLDKMNTKNLGKMLEFVHGEKEIAEGNQLLNQYEEERQKEEGLLNQPNEPEAVAGEPTAIVEPIKQQDYGQIEKSSRSGEETQKVTTRTGALKTGTPVSKKSPISVEAKQVVAEYDTEARNPSISEQEKEIASILITTKLDRTSIKRFGDENAITPSMAKQYIVGQGKGSTIDQVAARVSASLGVEVTPDQVWEFMKNYPRGPRTISTPSGNPKLAEISNRYSELTGKAINQKIARNIVEQLDFYDSIAGEIENSELDERQKNSLESVIFESGIDEVSVDNEEKALDAIIEAHTENGKVNWKKLQENIDNPLGSDSRINQINELNKKLYDKLREQTASETQSEQGDSKVDDISQGQAGQQRGLAERIKGQIRSLRSAKTNAEKVTIAASIVADTGKYLLNRQGVITGSDASFADRKSDTFFDLIDAGKSVYLLDNTSKIAETEEDYQKINAKLKDKVKVVNGSIMFDDAFGKGAIQAAKDFGFDAIRLTEIDGTNSTLQILNFDKLTHVEGEDFVSKIQKSKDERANDLLADGFSELADVVGAKKNITGSQAKLNAALVKIGKGLILKGEAKLENVIEKIKEFLAGKGITVSDEQLNEVKTKIKSQLKTRKRKKRTKAGTKKKRLFQHLDFARAEILKTFGENYQPQSNEETKQLTDDFIKKMGSLDEAFEAKNLVHPAVKAILYAEKLDALRNEMDTNKDAMAEYMQLMDELQVMTKEGGQAIQILDYIYQNYGMMFTAENQIKKFKDANSGHIPAEMATKFKELEKKHNELEEKVKKLQADKDEMQGKIDMLNIKQSNKRSGNIRSQKAKEMIRDAQEERSKLWKELTKLSSARAEIIPVTAITYGVKIANTFIKEGFARGVIGIDEVMRQTTDFWKKATGKDLTDAEIAAIRKEIEPTLTFGNIKIAHNWIKELVQQGFNTIEKLVPEVLKELKKVYPEITERQVRDLITGYGKIVNPSKDELNTTIRKIKRMGRIKSVIEDLHNKKRPLKSGLQRDKPGVQERNLMREIRELLKDVPVDDVTESNQLKTALDAKKTRLKNRIEDLNDALKKGKKIANKEKSLTDEEIEELTAIRDFNQEVYDSVFKDEKTDQRINRLIKGYEAAIEKIRYRIEHLGEEIYTAEKDEVKDPIINSLKERFDKMLDFYNQMREDAGLAELDRLDNMIANAKKLTDKYEERIKNGDFARRTMKPSYLGAETGVYQAQLDEMKDKLKYAENKAEAQKEIDTLTKFIAKIEELQKVQTERQRVRDEFTKEQLKNELANRDKWEKNLDTFLDALSIPRQLNAGFEFSSVFIQGRTYTIHFIKQDILSAAKRLLTGKKQEYHTIKNFENMFKSFWTQKAHDLNMDKLTSNEAWKRAKQSKLAIHDKDIENDAKAETRAKAGGDIVATRLISQAFDKLAIPLKWLGFEKTYKKWTDLDVSKKFERSAQMYLNAVRFQRYLQLEEKIRKEGKNFISNPDDYKQAASAINTLSGATNVGIFEGKFMRWSPLIFYSFRMMVSVLKQVSPLAFIHLLQLHAKGDPLTKPSVAQKAAVSDFAISVGLQAMLMVSFAAMMQSATGDDDDWTVELDPRSSKFMQIRVKGKDGHVTYIDAWGGLRTAIVFQIRWMLGDVKNRNGEIKALGSRNVPTRKDIAVDYLANKASPVTQPILYFAGRKQKFDKRTGETIYTDEYGNEFAFANEVGEKLYPMYFNSIYEMKDTQSPEMSMFGALIGLFGVNTNTYDETPKKKK